MKLNRSAGILLHPTSLPGNFGIGDLGPAAYKFVDFLEKSGQGLWQVFPLGPTGYGDSPYQCFSAFAGNPNLISPELLLKDGLLKKEDLQNTPEFGDGNINFGDVINFKKELLHKAHVNFLSSKKKSLLDSYEEFVKKEKEWLDDYSLFMASKDFHGGVLWTEWDKSIALRDDSKMSSWKKKLAEGVKYHKFVQFCFLTQWLNIKEYANKKSIQIVGDLPIFVAYDSADVWANKELFSVDKTGKLKTVAGVPPDYFSKTGQLWGNPLYNWQEMAKDDYLWWRNRIKSLLKIIDIIRIDHFRGFEAFWQIPGNAPTAQKGKWVKAPGKELFSSIEKHLGKVPILAEDLGVITPEVEDLRDTFNFPGMKILQFSFGATGEKKFLPHNYIKNCVVYTGSHDNDTTRGFFEEAKKNGNKTDIYKFAQEYLNCYGNEGELVKAALKSVYSSVADTVIIPMQDLLNLGTEARMNFPGKLGGNWGWRLKEGDLRDDYAAYISYLMEIYQRAPVKKKVATSKKK